MTQFTPGEREPRRARRSHVQTETPPPVIPRASRKKRGSVLGVALCVIGLAAVFLLSPLHPARRATYTAATEDGTVASLIESGEINSDYVGLRISEIMPSNHTSVPDETGAYPDWVEVWNSSDHDMNLAGVGLSDRGDSIRFLFPEVTLKSNERTVVFCDSTNLADPSRPFHAKFKLSSVGETVYLYDPNAYLIDSVTYHIMGSDTSWSLTEGSWQEVSYFSPGYENSAAGYEAYRTNTMVSDGVLIINEIMADARSGLPDEDNEYSDWVELYNTSDQTVQLSNYALSDKENKPLEWRFPEGAVIAPHGYYLVFCSGKDRRDSATSIPHTNFRLSAERDTIILSDSYGRVVDRVMIDNLPEDATWAREANGVFTVHQMATPGRDNSDTAGADLDMRRRNTLGVYITEVMASNDSVTVGEGTGFVDWIEIHNDSSEIVDLSGCGLSDNIGRPRRWQFPEGTVIYPNEYKTIYCDGKADQSSQGELHTNFKILRAGGETVCLSTPQGFVLDKLVLPLIPTNVSYGRTSGTTGFFYYDTPTPLAANGTGFKGYAGTPAFTVEGGLHTGVVSTAIIVPEGCTVYYTTDGSIPTTSSTLYKGESIEMNFTTVLRAKAFPENDLHESSIATATYLINTFHTLPVVSVVCDPNELWNPTNGLLVLGENADKTGGPKFKNTVYREFGKIPRPCHVEFYQLDGTKMLDQDCQFELQGDYSLDMPQKSMKFRSKSIYGEKLFNAALFEDRPYTEYKGFALRNSGNDCMWTRLLDGFESRLLDVCNAQVIHQAWNPVVVYINGEYWGHMNMRERVDRFFVAQYEGIPLSEANNMTILRASNALEYGTAEARREYRNMVAKIKASSPATNAEDRKYLVDNVDIDNLIEYMSFEMFVGNSDIGNTRFYRLAQEGSKWRWIWYDADYGLFSSSFNSPRSYTKASGMGEKNIDNTLFLKMLSVPEFRDRFLTRFGEIFQTLTTEKMLEVLEPLVELITPEMELHWARWGEFNDKMVIDEVPVTADGAYRYWEKRLDRLRNTLKKRPNLLWGMIQDEFNLTNAQMVHYFGERPVMPADAI